jgi:arylsulfatase A-like enzyme
MQRDLLLVTVDCWRHDAPERMPKLTNATSDWTRGDAMCSGAATNGVFPALFASEFPPVVYDSGGAVRDDVKALPDVLSESGYETGAFVASNPFLGKWSRRFDTFWNDGMTAEGVEENRDAYTFGDKLRSLLRLRSRVTAPEVLDRASEWWRQTDGPRFCWVHLMDPHGPYYPGLKRGISNGLLRSYLSIVGYSKLGPDVPEWMRRQLRELHFSCVDLLDEWLTPWLDSFDDPLVVLTGDHGEEFDHGMYGHSRLYDETVRVPFYTNDAELLDEGDLVRQLDISPRICRRIGISRPPSWRGSPATEDSIQCMLSKTEEHGRTYVGARSHEEKVIREFDWDGDLLSTEMYDLDSDPDETAPDADVADRLTETLDEFLARDAISESLGHGRQTGIDGDVSQRLRELGYAE